MKTYLCLNCNNECLRSHSKSNKYCNNQCQKDYEYKSYIAEWLTGKTSKGSNHIKRYILEQQSNKCAHCGISEWQGNPIVLELEHKDGDSSNNHLNNLECLCPNCHSQTPTYKNRNKGNGRHARRVRYSLDKSY